MRWDPLLARALARELDTRLRGKRVRALLLDAEHRRVTLYLREATLVAELHPLSGWISLLGPAEPSDGARPLPARVSGVEPLPDESALVIGLPRVRGKDEGVELVIEMAGIRREAALVGHRSRTVRHLLFGGAGRGPGKGSGAAGARGLRVGAPWVSLPTGSRKGLPGGPPLDGEAFRALVEEGRGALLRNVAGASSLNVEALLAPGGPGFLGAMGDPGAWGGWITPSPKGEVAYPLPLDPEARPFPSLLDAVSALRKEEPGPGEAALLVPASLLAAGEEALRRRARKAGALRRELEGAPDPAPLRAVGDLLLARFAAVPTGVAEVELAGFDDVPVRVALDPALPVHENAKRYYDRAGRAERARAELPARIEAAAGAEAKLRALLEGVRSGTRDPEELAGVVAGEGPALGGRSVARGGDGSPALPYRRFRSSGGLEIRVGRGARKNDDLTFRHAAPDDVWLHVRESPGAHVVLRWGRSENPPARDLEEAAILAALHSDARHAGVVPVDWTLRKHVRKPRKAPPGAVIPDRVKTLFVEPDPGLPDRLSGED
jgi:hypothetical protein